MSVHSYAQEYLLSKAGKMLVGESGKFVKFDGTDFVMDSINSNDLKWPLLAPTGFTPSFSFKDYPGTGMFSPDGGIYLYTQNADSASNVIAIYAGLGTDVDGGPFEMSAGASTNANGGYFLITAGDSDNGLGGGFTMRAGNSSVSDGGGYNIQSGSGNQGGNFTIAAGNGINKNGGSFNITSGNGNQGGDFNMTAGNSTGPTNGGTVSLNAGDSDLGDGGIVYISGGNSPSNGSGGDVAIYAGTGNTAGNVLIYGGNPLQTMEGAVILGTRVRFRSYTSTVRNAIVGIQAGDTIFCTDCTANDSSTGVLQTYNGSSWKNLW